MKLVCPKCQARLRISDQQVPANGAWAKCPKCRERFFINPAAQSAADLTRPYQSEKPNGPASIRRDQSSQQLIERLRTKRGLEAGEGGGGFDPDLVTVYPELRISQDFYQPIGLALLAVPVLCLVWLLTSLDTAPRQIDASRDPQKIMAAKRASDNNIDLVRQDLLNIKRDLMRRPRQVVSVDHTGPESRVFNYFMSDMLPGVCSGIDYIEVSDLKPAYGFAAKARCVDMPKNYLEMKVEWVARKAVVTFPYYRTKDEIDLYPPSGSQRL